MPPKKGRTSEPNPARSPAQTSKKAARKSLPATYSHRPKRSSRNPPKPDDDSDAESAQEEEEEESEGEDDDQEDMEVDVKVAKGRKRKVEAVESSSPGAGSQVEAIVSGIRKKLKTSTMSKQAKEKENDEFGQLLARFETGCGEAKKQFEAISAGPLGVAKVQTVRLMYQFLMQRCEDDQKAQDDLMRSFDFKTKSTLDMSVSMNALYEDHKAMIDMTTRMAKDADARLEVIRAAIARFDASQKSQIAKAQEHIQTILDPGPIIKQTKKLFKTARQV